MTFYATPGETANQSNAGFVLGTTSTYTTTAATSVVINGKFATSLGVQTNTATPTVDANTGLAFPTLAANQATALVFGVNFAGAIQMCQGSIVPTTAGVTTTAGAFIGNPQFPQLPENFAPLAYTIVRTSPTGSAFTAGTTAWAASGITCSVAQNVGTLPDRTQQS